MNISNFQMMSLKKERFTNTEVLKKGFESSNFFDLLKNAGIQNKPFANGMQNTRQATSFASKPFNRKDYFDSSNAINKSRENFEKKDVLEEKMQEDKKSAFLQTKHICQQMKKGVEADVKSGFVEQKELELPSEEVQLESEAAQNLQVFLQTLSAMITEFKEITAGMRVDSLEGLDSIKNLSALESEIEMLNVNENSQQMQEFAKNLEGTFEEMKAVLQTQTDAKRMEQNAKNALQDLFQKLDVSLIKVREFKAEILR